MDAELFSIFGLPGESIEDAMKPSSWYAHWGAYSIQFRFAQMQLYFGSIYERKPERYGIKLLPGYRRFTSPLAII